MRNLKKILALVLALMMTVSLMVVASAASYDDYSDKEQIDETYAEAVEVLAGIGMYQGDTEGTFRPQENLSRAEVAVLLYRLDTGDYDGSKVDTYAGYDEFTDVPSTEWYAGYVNYAYVAGWIIGNGDGTFGPENNVTGAELATMLLRALGRDAEGEEISGDNWALDASVLAAKLGLNKNLPSVFMSKDATREQTAQMIFNALNTNTWRFNGLTYRETNQTLIGLKPQDGHDDWGRPGVKWTIQPDSKKAAEEVAFIAEEPIATYYEAVTECDVATKVGFDGTKTYDTYTNGVSNKTANVAIEAKDTVNKIGAQGRTTEIYEDEIVYIDTVLARVDNVVDATYDDAGHLKTSSELYLTVYDHTGRGTGDNNGAPVYLTGGKVDYPYTKGSYLLLNVVTNSADNTYIRVGAQDKGNYYNGNDTVKVVDVAPSVTGAYTGYNTLEHTTTVGETTYPNANKFILGNTQATINTTYVWFLDGHGNIIGKTLPAAAAAQYAIVTAIAYQHNGLNNSYVETNLVNFAGENMNGVRISDIENSPNDEPGNVTTNTASSNVESNGAYYIGEANEPADQTPYFFTYSYNSAKGTYALSEVQATKSTQTKIVTGEALLHTDSATTLALGNSKTVYLVYNGTSYTSYTGYTNVPTLDNVDIYYVLGSGSYASYVYIDASAAITTTGTYTGYVFQGDVKGQAVIAGNTYNIYQSWVNGVSTYFYATTAQMTAVDADGLYTYSVDANGVLRTIADYAGATTQIAGTCNTHYFYNGTVIQAGWTGYNVASAPVYVVNTTTDTVTTYAAGTTQADAAITGAAGSTVTMTLVLSAPTSDIATAVYVIG